MVKGAPEGGEQWRDDPIASASEDRLGRLGLAKRVAQLVAETYSADSSVVHGLVGPWGSGKSSVLALTETQLADLDDGWLVVRFSPWATSDLNGLLAEFYGALVEALPRKRGVAEFKRGLGEVMNATAPIASMAGSLVGVGAAGEALKKGSELLTRDKSWSARFTAASKSLRKLEIKLLVVADDIDRLHGDELLNFLRLVRLVGRFPGLSYLIAYDEAGLLASIEAAGTAVRDSERAQDFLEKFVQYPIYLPPLIEGQIIDLLNEALDPVVASSRHRFEAPNGRLSFAHAWVDLLDTPRAINRFAAQVRLILPLHRPGEVDLVDVVLLTLLRLHAPQVFDVVSRSKALLTTPRTDKEPFEWSARVGARVSDRFEPAIRELVGRVFPATTSRASANVDPPRAGHPDYFDRYFLQGIPDDDIADGSVQLAIDEANKGEIAFLDVLIRNAKSDTKCSTLFGKLQRLSNWGDEAGGTPVAVLNTILKHLDSLPKKSQSLLPSPHQRAQRWAGQMLLCLTPAASKSEVSDALAHCKDELERTLLLETVVHSDDPVPPDPVMEVAAEVALSHVDAAIANVLAGDAADRFGVVERWTLLVRAVALDEARKRIQDALAAGMSADDLAARFASISHWRDGSGEESIELGSFLWEAYRELLPDGLTCSAPAPEYEINREDVSWESRRQVALRALAG